MNLPQHQLQRDGAGPNPNAAASVSWEGDQMLHIYLCDYLRKRGFSQAALALRLEAGLDPDRPVPIDAPQGLLFEWWVVFWDVFASRSLQPSATATGLAADARTYTLSQTSKMADGRSAPPVGQPSQPTAHNFGPSGSTAPSANLNFGPTTAQNAVSGRRLSQIGLGPSERSEASSSSMLGAAHAKTSPPAQQAQQQPKSAASALPQLDLEASQMLGLTRPASRVVIQQCMDMMNFGAKQIEHLSTEERTALAKRVTRLQTAQNEAQLRLAQLHGLQTSRALVGGAAGASTSPAGPAGPGQSIPPRMQRELSSNTSPYAPQAGQKRKESPNPDAGADRVNRASLAPAPLLRRLSYQAQTAVPSAPSPLTPSNGSMPFSQVSPHPMMQPSPASSAPTPMNPPARRPSVFEPASQTSSPLRTTVYASGLPSASPGPGNSVSPLGEWHGPDHIQTPSAVPPLQQQQRPVVMPSSLDAPAFHSRAYMPPSYISQPQAAMTTPRGPPHTLKDHSPGFQLSMPPAAKPSVFASAETAVMGGMHGGASGMGGGGSGPVTPFADLEYDFNVLLSNTTQLNRDETSALARQLGGVGGS